MSIIEIVIAIVVLLLITSFITYVVGLFSMVFHPTVIALVSFGLALDIVLYIIHRKD